jgi:hypothetical protein
MKFWIFDFEFRAAAAQASCRAVIIVLMQKDAV